LLSINLFSINLVVVFLVWASRLGRPFYWGCLAL
jgi:hypothetical protein